MHDVTGDEMPEAAKGDSLSLIMTHTTVIMGGADQLVLSIKGGAKK